MGCVVFLLCLWGGFLDNDDKKEKPKKKRVCRRLPSGEIICEE